MDARNSSRNAVIHAAKAYDSLYDSNRPSLKFLFEDQK